MLGIADYQAGEGPEPSNKRNGQPWESALHGRCRWQSIGDSVLMFPYMDASQCARIFWV